MCDSIEEALTMFFAKLCFFAFSIFCAANETK